MRKIMAKENIYKIFYTISTILVIVFVIISFNDYLHKEKFITVTLEFDLIIRTLEFFIPSIISFIIAKILKRKFDTKSKN